MKSSSLEKAMSDFELTSSTRSLDSRDEPTLPGTVILPSNNPLPRIVGGQRREEPEQRDDRMIGHEPELPLGDSLLDRF